MRQLSDLPDDCPFAAWFWRSRLVRWWLLNVRGWEVANEEEMRLLFESLYLGNRILHTIADGCAPNRADVERLRYVNAMLSEWTDVDPVVGDVQEQEGA